MSNLDIYSETWAMEYQLELQELFEAKGLPIQVTYEAYYNHFRLCCHTPGGSFRSLQWIGHAPLASSHWDVLTAHPTLTFKQLLAHCEQQRANWLQRQEF